MKSLIVPLTISCRVTLQFYTTTGDHNCHMSMLICNCRQRPVQGRKIKRPCCRRIHGSGWQWRKARHHQRKRIGGRGSTCLRTVGQWILLVLVPRLPVTISMGLPSIQVCTRLVKSETLLNASCACRPSRYILCFIRIAHLPTWKQLDHER